MALQLWFPLNKNEIKNLGLKNTTLHTSNGPTYNSSGKIGGCFSFSNSYIYGDSGPLSNSTLNFSIAFWVNYDNLSNYHCMYQQRTTTGEGITVWKNGNHIRFDDGSSMWETNYTFTAGVWTHVCVTRNTTNKKLYINGELKDTGNSGTLRNVSTKFVIGKSAANVDNVSFSDNMFYGKLSDVRIYDHCLSEDEIHELSLGKVGHWKLNDAEIESTTNILNSVTATCYNGANSKYGYSTESNVLKTDGEFLNKQCTKIYPATNGSSWRPYTYLPTYVSNGGTDSKYKTLQFDYYSTTSTYLNPYKLGNGNSTAHWKCVNSTGVHTGSGVNNVNITVNPNEWNHVEIIFEGTSSASAQWGYFINGNAVTSSSNTYHLYANVMVEEKDHSTPYTKTSRVKGNVPDISGNHHDLTVNGNPTLSDDSVRYDKSCLFGGGISMTPLVPSFLTNEATVSMWVKLDQLPPSSPGRTMLYTTWYGFSCEVTSAGKTYFRTQLTSGTVDSPQGTITAGNWTHWVGVKSSTGVSLYLNGTLVGTASNSNNFNWSSSASNAIGAYGGSYYTYGKLSDVRLYATALSADDVLKLYKLGNV